MQGMRKTEPYMIIHDGPLYIEISDDITERRVMNWLEDLGLTVGDMYLSMDGIEYYNLRKM